MGINYAAWQACNVDLRVNVISKSGCERAFEHLSEYSLKSADVRRMFGPLAEHNASRNLSGTQAAEGLIVRKTQGRFIRPILQLELSLRSTELHI